MIAAGSRGLEERPGRPLLEVDGVCKRFGRKTVLKAASYSARAGTITTLMGLNGAGKTTLLRISVGRLRADAGRVLLRGTYLPRPSLPLLARQGVFYAAQKSALTDLFTVRQQLDAVAGRWESGPVDEVVSTFDLEETMDRRPGQISGGERQRVSLAMALLRNPDLLLMDEPFSEVSPTRAPLVTRGLETLRRRGCAVVITGHEVDRLMAVSDQIIWVVAGTTHWLGAPEEAGQHEQFRREYLGPRAPPRG